MKVQHPFIIVMAAVAIAASCSEQNNSRPFMTALNVVGSVTIAGTTGEREIKSGDKIYRGETVNTGEKSVADIVSAGGEFLRILENSSVFFPEMGDRTRLFMDRGKLFLILSKSLKDGFILDTPFLVMTADKGSCAVSVAAGAAKIDTAAGIITARPVLAGIVTPDVSREIKAKQTLLTAADEKAFKGKGEFQTTEMQPAEIDALLKEAADVLITAVTKMDEPSKNIFGKEIRQMQEDLKGKSPILTAGKVLIQGTVTEPSE